VPSVVRVRDDQYARLKDVAEKLADVVIHDANPDNWTATGKASKQMTKDERGDAYWDRKLAAASISVLVRVYSVTGMVERAGDADPEAPIDDSLDKEVSAAEREAKRILSKLATVSRAKHK
jgi:hypothetical protein